MIAELIWTLPFAALLASIALFPLLNKHWWDKNYPWVSLGLGAVVVFHILFQLKNPEMLLGTAHEYFSFIALIVPDYLKALAMALLIAIIVLGVYPSPLIEFTQRAISSTVIL